MNCQGLIDMLGNKVIISTLGTGHNSWVQL